MKLTLDGNLHCLILLITLCAASDEKHLSDDKFSTVLYDNVFKNPGNIFFSPVSVKALLMMAHAGAGGRTLLQLSQVAGLGDLDSTKHLIGLFDSEESNITLRLANGVFANQKLAIKPEYEVKIKKEYGADFKLLNFMNSGEATTNINAWVAEKTSGKIPHMFEDGALKSATQLVLLNAVYFKGEWQQKFSKEGTKMAPFYLNEKESKEMEFMKLTAELRTFDGPQAQIVELPYEGSNVSMILVVSKKGGGLPALEAQLLHTEPLPQLLSQLTERDVTLEMPKFGLQHTLQLKPILQAMGITDLFSASAANLSGISDMPLFVSEAIQKSAIEVTEDGAEAAAASGFSVGFRMALDPPLKITVNSPFLFFIQSGEDTLFAGRFAGPD